MKKYLLPLLIVVFVMQLLVPAYMIWEKYDVLRTGEEVKIKVRPIDPYDAFRGRYVALGYDYALDYSERRGQYGILAIGADGFAKLVRVTDEKPVGRLYLTGEDDTYFQIPMDRYYMEESLAPKAERKLSKGAQAYITVRIKNEKAVISRLYINGVPAEDYLSE